MQWENEVQHVFLVGAKSLGAYGGYETFVYKLTEYHQNKKNIKYHVACKANGDGCMDETKVDGVTRINDHEFEFHNAHCFKIDIPQIGPAQAIYYDVAALKACCKYIKEHRIKHPIVYIMACRIGPFAGHFYKEIHKLGGTVYLNPDGHEWMRAKWSAPIRRYWKISEQMMVKYCDLAICDSVNAHERYTVFALHNCTHYYYESQGNEHQTIPHNHFEDMEWHIRLVLEGEDRLVRNLEARESETFSYAADVNPEYNNEMEDPRINVMDFVLNKEFLRKASELLKKHQWEMICRHYIEGMTHREIAAEMGVSHQYVTKGIKKGLHRIRCTYT